MRGTLAAWSGPGGHLVTLDQHTGAVRAIAGAGRAADDGGVLAMDGRTVYWRSGRGVVAVETDTARVALLSRGRLQVFDAKGSVLAFSDATRDLKVGTSLAAAPALVAWSLDPHGGDEPVVLSPTGRWVAVAHVRISGWGEQPEIEAHLSVYDVRTRAATALHLPGGPWLAVAGVWLGDATLQVLGLVGDPPFAGRTLDPALFSCSLPSGTCRRIAGVGRIGGGTEIPALPDGRWSSDD
jgi:hypothetical protein